MISWRKSRGSEGGLPPLPVSPTAPAPAAFASPDTPLEDSVEHDRPLISHLAEDPQVDDAPAEAFGPPRRKLLVGRHNGIGDIVMAIPFIAGYLEMGYDVTLACDPNNHGWLPLVLPELKIIDCPWEPYKDFHQVADGFDVYLNLNRVEILDDMMRELHVSPINMQLSYSILAAQKGLPRPKKGLSPSRYIDYRAERGEEVLIFTRSTHPSRSLAPEVVSALRRSAPGALIDPKFPDLVTMCKAIAAARAVIGVDSGAVHLAEVFRTPWRVLHTTMDFEKRHHFYEHGSAITSLQAATPCSPCFQHSGCDNVVCTSSFDTKDILAGFC